MSVKLLSIGTTRYSYLKEGLSDYTQRINRYFKFETIEIPDVKNRARLDPDKLKEEEADAILKIIRENDTLIVLDERGMSMSSLEFAQFLQNKLANKRGSLMFVVGGMYGIDQKLKLKAESQISLSKFTWSHQMVRLLFTEQLYRACTILKGEPYHNE